MEDRMVRDCGERPHDGFRHVMPLLLIPVVFGVVHGVMRHKFAHLHEQGRANWENGVPPMFAEMHRRAHAAEAAAAAAPAPAGPAAPAA